MPDGPLETPALILEDSARRVGAYRWIEHRLFEVTGGWSLADGHPAVQVHCAEVSQQHAWHAELWEARLPLVAWADHGSLTRAPDGVTAAVDAVARFADPVEGLAGLYRVVLPRLLTTYGQHASLAAPATDGPVLRALTLVRRDEVAQLLAGEALLESLVDQPDALARAHHAAASVESLVAGSSGLWDAETGPQARARAG